MRRRVESIMDATSRTNAPSATWATTLLRATSAGTPSAWVVRSVLEGIIEAAVHGTPHHVRGELLGYWVAPHQQPVVSDWCGYGSALFRARGITPSKIWKTLDDRGVRPSSSALRVPIGTWSTTPRIDAERVRGSGSDTERRGPWLTLLLDEEHAWRPRLWMLPPLRWPWDILRTPRELEIHPFSPPIGG
jgi:hypothetical protein